LQKHSDIEPPLTTKKDRKWDARGSPISKASFCQVKGNTPR
jgi:hypothetical protein